MFLFWMAYATPKGTVVFIQPSYELGMARMGAALAGAPDDFREGYQLDSKTTKKVPKAMIGRILTANEGQALLKKFR
jgi:hypothetical protein